MKREIPKRTRGKRKRTEADGERNYRVGFARPPEEHEFKPGQSGNPRGRRKGVKNHDTILREILYRKLPIRDRGKIRHVPLIEAMLLKFAERGLGGDVKAAAFLLNRHVPQADDPPSSAEVTREDLEVLNAYAAKIKAK